MENLPAHPLEIVNLIHGQLQFVRQYTLSLLADVPDEQWFQMPAGLNTHIAWQVGHIAMAEYGLGLFRIRGRQEHDIALMPSHVRKLYSKGSTPDPDATQQPTPAELRSLLARIHEQVLQELGTFTEAQLLEPAEMPYAVYPVKLGSLLFCPQHEMLHAGQIGILRRHLGLAPVR